MERLYAKAHIHIYVTLEDDGTYDVDVFNDDIVEREESLEERFIKTIEEAKMYAKGLKVGLEEAGYVVYDIEVR